MLLRSSVPRTAIAMSTMTITAAIAMMVHVVGLTVVVVLVVVVVDVDWLVEVVAAGFGLVFCWVVVVELLLSGADVLESNATTYSIRLSSSKVKVLPCSALSRAPPNVPFSRRASRLAAGTCEAWTTRIERSPTWPHRRSS